MRALIFVLLLGCAREGFLATEPGVKPPVARVKVRVLANHEGGCGLRVHGEAPTRCDSGSRALLAETQEQLADLWNSVGLDPPLPRVDFKRDIVLGSLFDGGVCEPTPEHARIDADRIVSFESWQRDRICIALLVTNVRVVAVPRSLVGEGSFVWLHEWVAARFAREPGTRATRGTKTLANVRGTVDLPQPGHIALRALPDGLRVWVAHHTDGGIAVIAADGVQWDDAAQHFDGGFDSYGRDPNGEYVLHLFESERDGDRVRVGLPYHIVDKKHPSGYLAGSSLPPENPASTPLVLDR